MELRTSAAALVATLLFLGAAGVAQAGGPWRANEGNTRGWMLMSPQERIAHQATIRSFTNYDDCHAYQVAHHRLMLERASRLALKLPEHGRDACAHLRPSPDSRH